MPFLAKCSYHDDGASFPCLELFSATEFISQNYSALEKTFGNFGTAQIFHFFFTTILFVQPEFFKLIGAENWHFYSEMHFLTHIFFILSFFSVHFFLFFCCCNLRTLLLHLIKQLWCHLQQLFSCHLQQLFSSPNDQCALNLRWKVLITLL